MTTSSARSGPGGLRYRALLDALWSLRGGPAFEVVAPSAPAMRYRERAVRGIAPLLDVYLPARELPARELPAHERPARGATMPERDATGASVVLVHGGGFVIGSRRMKPMRYLASRLVASGVAVCAIDYRMIFRGGRLEEAVDDVRAALAFWRERAPRHGLDRERVSMIGLSAGGTLSMLAASREEGAVHRLACCFGLYELDHLHGPLASVVPRLLFETPDRDAWGKRSPRGAAQPAIPTLLLHGTADGLVPVEQARRLAAHREALGLATKLVIYPDAPHGFFNGPCAAADDGARELALHVR